jgi:glycosyltransferase involved in cell wall biosynthesis
MRLTYLTRVAVPSTAAQAGQILSMSQAFHRVLGEGFRLESGAGSEPAGEQPFSWTRRAIRHPAVRYPAFCAAAVREARSRHAPVVFTRDIGVAAAAVMSGGRAVFEAHKEPIGRFAHALVARLAGSPRFRLVAISQALADRYARDYRIPQDRLLTAHDGIFPERYPPLDDAARRALRARLGLPADRILVVHTGSLLEGRGAELFEHVCRADPRVLFVQVGGVPADVERIRRHHAERGIDNLVFVDRQPGEIVRQYQTVADLLFYMTTRRSPIYWCTSPLKLFEYLASGRPILGSAIGSVAEIIDDANAFCFDPERPASIGEAFGRFLADPAEAARRAAAGRERALAEYSWYRRAERIVGFSAP